MLLYDACTHHQYDFSGAMTYLKYSHVLHGLGHSEPHEEAIMRMRTQFLY